MSLLLPRRSFLTGLASLFAAPAIVRASSLMPVGNIDHILYPMRGLIDYMISTDNLVIRVDRANVPMNMRPRGVAAILTDEQIKRVFTKEQLNELIPTKPYQQKHIWKEFHLKDASILELNNSNFLTEHRLGHIKA